MWHEIIVDNEDRSIHSYFSDMLLEISNVKSGFLFYLCERYIKEIISRNVEKKEIATKETLPVSKEKKRILYYVSDYIIFSMIEKFKKIMNINEKKYCSKRCLESNMF